MSIAPRWRQLAVQWSFDVAGPIHIGGTAVLLPFIQQDLALSRTTVSWVLVVYYLSTASFILAGAYLGNIIGRRRLVITGVTIDLFCQVSMVFAPGFWALVLLRLMGGIGNAMTITNLAPLTVSAFPSERRGQVLGLISAGLGVGILLSSVIAGVVADSLGMALPLRHHSGPVCPRPAGRHHLGQRDAAAPVGRLLPQAVRPSLGPRTGGLFSGVLEP